MIKNVTRCSAVLLVYIFLVFIVLVSSTEAKNAGQEDMLFLVMQLTLLASVFVAGRAINLITLIPHLATVLESNSCEEQGAAE